MFDCYRDAMMFDPTPTIPAHDAADAEVGRLIRERNAALDAGDDDPRMEGVR